MPPALFTFSAPGPVELRPVFTTTDAPLRPAWLTLFTMALLERSQNILDVYQGHHLHSTRLKDELQERIDQASLKASEDITQHTNSSHGDAASTTAAFIQQDPSSLAKEVAQQEEFTKQVKFLWAESNNKRKFVHYLMDGHREHITSRQCMQAEEARLAAKAELKGWKQAAQERRDRIAATARQLDSGRGCG